VISTASRAGSLFYGELDAANAIAVEKRIAGGPGTGAKEAVSTRNVPLMRRRIGIVFRALFLCGMQVSLADHAVC
jgi:hypothetical protein